MPSTRKTHADAPARSGHAGLWLSLLLSVILAAGCDGSSIDRATAGFAEGSDRGSDHRTSASDERPDDAGGPISVADRKATARSTLARLVHAVGYDPGDIEVDQPLEPSGGEQAAVRAATIVDHQGDPLKIIWFESPPDRSRHHGPRSELEVDGVLVTFEEPVESTGWSPSAWFDCGDAEIAVTHRPDGPDGEVRVIIEVATELVGAEDCRAAARPRGSSS